jgi:hypothetical protein
VAKRDKTAASAGRGSGTGSGLDKTHGKAVLAPGSARPLGTPQQGKYLENRKKMLNRGNEAKHLLKKKEIGYFRGQKRTYFSLRKAPNEAKLEAGKRATGNADFGQYRVWRGRAA